MNAQEGTLLMLGFVVGVLLFGFLGPLAFLGFLEGFGAARRAVRLRWAWPPWKKRPPSKRIASIWVDPILKALQDRTLEVLAMPYVEKEERKFVIRSVGPVDSYAMPFHEDQPGQPEWL